MPDGLAAFLAARLDEAEAAARAASSEHLCPEARDGRWQVVGKRNVAYRNASEIIAAIDVTGGTGLWYEQVSVKGDPDMAVASHIAANDPARTLRSITADRALIAEYRACREYSDSLMHPPFPADVVPERLRAATQVLTMERVLMNRAAIHSDHPGWDPSWAPLIAPQPATTP